MPTWFGRPHLHDHWEVVDSKHVDPVGMYDEDDELELLRVSSTSLSSSCIFDVDKMNTQVGDHSGRHLDLQIVLLKTRSRLLRDIARVGYNILLLEGWSITLLRKISHIHNHPRYRISVRYTGRPAYVEVTERRPFPPFLGLLQSWQEEMRRLYLHQDGESDEVDDSTELREQRRRSGASLGTSPMETEDRVLKELQEVRKSRWASIGLVRRMSAGKDAVSVHVARFISFQLCSL